MPPNEICPVCFLKVLDWHLKWYGKEGSLLFHGKLALDCPLCGAAIGFEGGKLGPGPFGKVVAKRDVKIAAQWAAAQAVSAGGTLEGYLFTVGAGSQYADYWTLAEIRQADATVRSEGSRELK